MNITLEYVAMLKVKAPASGSSMVLPDRSTVADLFNLVGLRPEHQQVVVAFVNNSKARLNQTLQEGDVVFLAMPVGGG